MMHKPASIVCLACGQSIVLRGLFLRLQHRLPRIHTPLLPGDPDVVLDIPAILTRCYDAARYDLDLDYTPAPSCCPAAS